MLLLLALFTLKACPKPGASTFPKCSKSACPASERVRFSFNPVVLHGPSYVAPNPLLECAITKRAPPRPWLERAPPWDLPGEIYTL